MKPEKKQYIHTDEDGSTVLESVYLDRSEWGTGEWDDEPDRVEWTDPVSGLPCVVMRNDAMGNWNGYVGVSPESPYHELEYTYAVMCRMNVHGGLTFSGSLPGRAHYSKDTDNFWWFGFDCAHAYDAFPHAKAYIHGDEVYRNLEYVKSECRSLARQLTQLQLGDGNE